MYDGLPVNGEYGGVPAPHPGHRVVVDLVDPAGQVSDLAQPHRHVAGGVEGEVGAGVEAGELRRGLASQHP